MGFILVDLLSVLGVECRTGGRAAIVFIEISMGGLGYDLG